MMQNNEWKKRVPALTTYNNYFTVKSPRLGSITKDNLSYGVFDTVIDALNMTSPIAIPPIEKAKKQYYPTKFDVERAASQISLGVQGNVVAILEKLEERRSAEDKKWPNDWRQVTKINIRHWFK